MEQATDPANRTRNNSDITHIDSIDHSECGKCEERPGTNSCSCGERFCDQCFQSHLRRNPNHQRAPPTSINAAIQYVRSSRLWSLMTISGLGVEARMSASYSDLLQKDEATKWFGIYTDSGSDRASKQKVYIAETPRFRHMVEESRSSDESLTREQFPSLVSFVGRTGSGKSLIIRCLMCIGLNEDMAQFERVLAPVNAQSASDFRPTTGEVHIYPDEPDSETVTPRFFVDCEGLDGPEPTASKHQTKWFNDPLTRKFLIEGDMDRQTAAKILYPRLLYIFSDVVCYVTPDCKAWSEVARNLLEWSTAGAQHIINQAVLPALIVILNCPNNGGRKEWVSEFSSDENLITNDFFDAIDAEIKRDNGFRDKASKYGATSMRELLLHDYSSIHFQYIPQNGLGELGTERIIWDQMKILRQKILQSSREVQRLREISQTQLNSSELIGIVEYAFLHLCGDKTRNKPFDFGLYQRLKAEKEGLDVNIATYLETCLGPTRPGFQDDPDKAFDKAMNFIATAIMQDSINIENKIFRGQIAFYSNIEEACDKAFGQFVETKMRCRHVARHGVRCLNTKQGHSKGHQIYILGRSPNVMPETLSDRGEFDDGGFDKAKLMAVIKEKIKASRKRLESEADSNPENLRKLVEKELAENIGHLREIGSYTSCGVPRRGDEKPNPISGISGSVLGLLLGLAADVIWDGPFVMARFCYGCLFGQSEYRLPCEHLICLRCLKSNDKNDTQVRLTTTVTLGSCPICGAGSPQEGWPFVVQTHPDIAGPRILSLDGGGVRGIIQLILLERLEVLIGLDLPIGRFFDLIVGTSAGGIIALGIGTQGLSVADCMERFEAICRRGFVHKLGTKTPIMQWVSRWLNTSIYHGKILEDALRDEFKRGNPTVMFGLKNHSRVAITTTVGQECRLITNYKRGEATGRYLESLANLWTVARCTSAAPMYFEPMPFEGHECRDGGLLANNPIREAFNESRKIWNDSSRPDLILSVGSGISAKPQKNPSGLRVFPPWLTNLFTILIQHINGEAEWKRFRENHTNDILVRCSRLNVDLPGEREPALDDTGKIEEMKTAAKNWRRDWEGVAGSLYTPIDGESRKSMLETQAEILRAGLFFFHLESITVSGNRSVTVRGRIRCRLGPSEGASFQKLLDKVHEFRVNRQPIKMTSTPNRFEPFDIEAKFGPQCVSLETLLRIDVSFGDEHSIAIAGFPKSFKDLHDYQKKSLTLSRPPLSESSTTNSNRASAQNVITNKPSLQRDSNPKIATGAIEHGAEPQKAPDGENAQCLVM